MSTRSMPKYICLAATLTLLQTGCSPGGDSDPAPMQSTTGGTGGPATTGGNEETGEVDSDASSGGNTEESGVADESGSSSETGTDEGPDTVIPDVQEPMLIEATTALNEACDLEIIATIDWDSFEGNYGLGPADGHDYGELDARSYCIDILDAFISACNNIDGDAETLAEAGLTQVHCYWTDELPYDPGPEIDTRENMLEYFTEDGAMTWGFNWWSANLTDQVHGWIHDL